MTAAIAVLLLADAIVLGLLLLLTRRRNRRTWTAHVDTALQVLGTRRPHDGLEDR